MKPVVINNTEVGDGAACYIVFEAGPTHNGLASAKRLADLTKQAGANAIKFQILDPHETIYDPKLPFSYQVLLDRESGATETVTEPLLDILLRRSLKEAEWLELKDHCDQIGLDCFATLCDDFGLGIARQANFASLKIASADVNFLPFIRQVASLGASVQLDTGNANIGEIEKAVEAIYSVGNRDVIIHNCPSGYPARLESIHLNLLPTLKQTFQCPVAYSDHSPGYDMDIAAVAIGANLLEKTITEDRLTRSVEHIMSIEPEEMGQFVDKIREIEVALGASRRILTDHELRMRKNIRRSAILAEDAEPGTPLDELKVEFKRPGLGIGPDAFEALTGLCLNRALPKGHLLSFADMDHLE